MDFIPACLYVCCFLGGQDARLSSNVLGEEDFGVVVDSAGGSRHGYFSQR